MLLRVGAFAGPLFAESARRPLLFRWDRLRRPTPQTATSPDPCMMSASTEGPQKMFIGPWLLASLDLGAGLQYAAVSRVPSSDRIRRHQLSHDSPRSTDFGDLEDACSKARTHLF